MLDHFAEALELPISLEQYFRLPYHPAYKAEYYEARAVLTFNPRTVMVRRRLMPMGGTPAGGIIVRPLDFDHDVENLVRLFVASFVREPPLDTMSDSKRSVAMQAALNHTASGGDGELIPDACLLAFDGDSEQMIGAAVVTRIRIRKDEWPEPEMPASIPNLTWIGVAPFFKRGGVGTTLLARVIERLIEHGETWLLSHILTGNAGSMLFHWHHLFELMPDPFAIRRRVRA